MDFSDIVWGYSNGVLSCGKDAIVWRSNTTESMKKITKDDVVNALWCQLGTKCYLKLFLKGGKVFRLTNFKKNDIMEISSFMKENFDRSLEEEKVACHGGNWTEAKFQGPNLVFRDDDKLMVEVPLETISQCALPGKNEIELQFHEDDTVAGDDESLVEMRVYVPAGEEEISAAEVLKNEVLERANITSFTGQSIVELDETLGTFLTPRGRYAIELYSTFLRMHGKTYDYKIMYSNINRCFLLERPDGISSAFVISLEEPIRQGKQGYPHLVLQLRKDETYLDVNLDADKMKKYNGNLAERMSGQLPQLVATLFKYLIGKKVYTSGKFKTHNGDRAIICALKASEGHLYPLEKSFMFIHKPTTFIRYDEISFVEFQRYSGQTGSNASRNFDLLVKCRQIGGEQPREYIFSAIDRREFPELSQFLGSKKISIRSLKETQPIQSGSKYDDEIALGPEDGEIDEEDEDEEEDSDFGPGKSSDDDESDASLSGGAASDDDNDDDEEEEDDDEEDEEEEEDDDDDGENPKKRKKPSSKQDKSRKK